MFTYIHEYTYSHFIDPSSAQCQLEYEIGRKKYWIVIHSLILVMNIHKNHKPQTITTNTSQMHSNSTSVNTKSVFHKILQYTLPSCLQFPKYNK